MNHDSEDNFKVSDCCGAKVNTTQYLQSSQTFCNECNRRCVPTDEAPQEAADRIRDLTDEDRTEGAREIAEKLHDLYEESAKAVGWKTQKDCQVKFNDLPEANKKVMLHTGQYVEYLINEAVADRDAIIRELIGTYIVDVDENGRPNKGIIELLDLSKRATDLITNKP